MRTPISCPGCLAILALILASCTGSTEYLAVSRFVLALDGEGEIVQMPRPADQVAQDPAEPEEPKDPLEARVDTILEAVREEFASRQKTHGDVGRRRRVLIHVHGGLNTFGTSLRHAYRSHLRMQKEVAGSQDYCVPIFVTWDSSFASSYVEHLADLRHGRHQRTAAIISSPIWFTADVAGGVVNTPRALASRLTNDIALGLKVPFDVDLLPSWKYAQGFYGDTQKLDAIRDQIILGSYSRSFWNHSGRFLWYLVTLAPSVALTSVGVDAMGKGGWDAMRHRAANLHRRYSGFKHHGEDADARELRPAPSDPAARERWLLARKREQGSMAYLIHRLNLMIREDAEKRPEGRSIYEVVLVGHSMGAIVLNDTLADLLQVEAQYPDRFKLPVRDIVYMGAACSIEEATQTVVPYVESHPGARFHNLTLHPMAEVDERNMWDFVPRGSLLEWIDNWYTSPATPAERRLGKWVNVMQCLKLFAPILERMTVKAFTTTSDRIPQRHGDFGSCPYWRQAFWTSRHPDHMAYHPRWDDRQPATGR